MAHLHQTISERVAEWRQAGYPSERHPVVSEILDYQIIRSVNAPRFLRWPQLRALETYWYLRVAEQTPHIFGLYQKYFPQTTELIDALGVGSRELERFVLDHTPEALWGKIRRDAAFVRRHRLESLRETLTLDYPNYIFALAMGAGKTFLIASIIATEFAAALDEPRGPFVQNALVFAPGKTILEALRQLAATPFEKVLPPRLCKGFLASVKLTFTRDGEKDLPIVRRSRFNVIVTNTEKIRIQKPTIRRKARWGQLKIKQFEEQEAEIANLRLQAIASLPHLAVFSDEAHHTFGRTLDTELKKVRKTVDYLHENTRLVCVVNTTGTPYLRRQPLKDVVVWYGLSQGIRDGILKEVAGNVFSLSFDDKSTDRYVEHVVKDFFKDYRDVYLPTGAPARLAIYFPQTDDLAALRPVVDAALAGIGLPATTVLDFTSKTPKENEDAFNRLSHDPTAPHRVILLVNKGTEGWDCPSLFACALARKLKTSNNFVLQAASRCLRQVPGNTAKGRIYLSPENERVLDRQLRETYGEELHDFRQTLRERGSARLVLRKLNLPPLVVKQVLRTVVRKDGKKAFSLKRPTGVKGPTLKKLAFDMASGPTGRRILRAVKEIQVEGIPEATDLYSASVGLAGQTHLDPWDVYLELRSLYPERALPEAHLSDLVGQLEAQLRNYEVMEETVEQALALVKTDGFDRSLDTNGIETWTAEIVYPKDRESLLVHCEASRNENPGDFGFHYSPYNFDSEPEKDFFLRLLQQMNLHPDEVDDIYFTGALTDPKKTDFRVEYRGEDGRWHDYTPDFIIRRKDGRCLIVEVKQARFKAVTEEDYRRFKEGEAAVSVEGRKAIALRRWEELNPEKIRYHIAFANGGELEFPDIKPALDFVEPDEP